MLRDINNLDILTLTIMGCLFLVALSKLLFPKRFNEFASLLFNSRYSNYYIKEQRFFDIFEGLLFINFSLNLGIILYLFLSNNSLQEITQLDLFIYAFLIGIFIILKVLLERLLSSLLDIEPLIDRYLFQKISIRNFIGLLLLPINTFLIYTIKPNQALLLAVAVLFILISIYSVFLFLKSNLNTFRKSLFYFILYLCTLEIAPYVVLYKIITTKQV
ncbi:DUF4271 domain-containing protein [Psychroserpens sp. NJDZ02]|uniref:DUF4271 domain-containing protein n=1 Tax=Psychroserpens sp. NJDZ02 TaxID=2570561 RepID=UPI0010A7BFF4|nr:DUF4271 domain-containing protein [Psychroserpens sp. NJDZ02]QCE41470.1 DUF4271 domain-containing protein [Psychroserpens sp. NJDZ02]